jgi:hypothetical protein
MKFMPKQRPLSPARIFPFLAADAPVGLIVRRGPSAYMGCIAWNRIDDTFTDGQSMMGRIYEERCDLSPDGKHFLYASLCYDRKSGFSGNLTSISRIPFLKSIVTYDAYLYRYGGVFTSNNTFWLQASSHVNWQTGRAPYDPFTCQRSSDQFQRDLSFNGKTEYDLTQYDYLTVRPLKQGWTIADVNRHSNGNDILSILFEKKLSKLWYLRKAVLNEWETQPREKFMLYNAGKYETINLNWDWGDIDGERLVWTNNGCLLTARIIKHGLCDERVLRDFNLMRFPNICAPY